LHNLNKEYLILAKFYINSALSIGNQSAKFRLNLSTQTIVRASVVRSPQNVKCPVLGNRLFNRERWDVEPDLTTSRMHMSSVPCSRVVSSLTPHRMSTAPNSRPSLRHSRRRNGYTSERQRHKPCQMQTPTIESL